MTNDFTLDVLLNCKNRLQSLLKTATYQDEIAFYNDCLKQTLKDIDNIDKYGTISGENSSNSDIFE